MTAPTDPPVPPVPPEGSADQPVDLGKHGAGRTPQPDPNDPYRFGLPERLPPPEYAPPGWTPPGGWPSAAPPPAGPPIGGLPPAGPSQFGPGAPRPPGNSPYPYGYPPAPPQYSQYSQYSPYQPPAPGRGKAVTALVLGVLSILMSWASFFDAVLVIAAVTFGVLALTERPAGSTQPRGMAIAGLVCAGVGALLAVIWTVFVIHAVNQCGGFDQTSQPGFRHCLQQQI